jgi:hypothetical protein
MLSGGTGVLTRRSLLPSNLFPADYLWFHRKEETHVPEMPA